MYHQQSHTWEKNPRSDCSVSVEVDYVIHRIYNFLFGAIMEIWFACTNGGNDTTNNYLLIHFSLTSNLKLEKKLKWLNHSSFQLPWLKKFH